MTSHTVKLSWPAGLPPISAAIIRPITPEFNPMRGEYKNAHAGWLRKLDRRAFEKALDRIESNGPATDSMDQFH